MPSWYRSFQTFEATRWMRGGYAQRISDFDVELVDRVGHWIVEQRPDLVADRLRRFLGAALET